MCVHTLNWCRRFWRFKSVGCDRPKEHIKDDERPIETFGRWKPWNKVGCKWWNGKYASWNAMFTGYPFVSGLKIQEGQKSFSKSRHFFAKVVQNNTLKGVIWEISGWTIAGAFLAFSAFSMAGWRPSLLDLTLLLSWVVFSPKMTNSLWPQGHKSKTL